MNNRPNVLAVCLSLIPSAMVGVVKPLQALEEMGIINFSFIESNNITPGHLANADTIICIRGCAYFEVDIIKAAREKGRKIIYFLDDDLLNVPDTATSHDYFASSKIKDNIVKLLKLSDMIITPNKNLGHKYGQYCSDVRNILVPALLLDEIDENPLAEKHKSKPVIIGFSGGIDHEWTVRHYLMNPIRQIQDEFGDKVKFEVMGPRPDFLEKFNVTYIPYETDYSKYVKKIVSLNWDIGLAPLFKSDFYACKFYNKYLEYGAIGAAGIYSKVEPYTHVIEDGVNGVLLEDDTQEAWVKAIRDLIIDQTARLNIAKNAFNHIKQNFSLTSVANQIIRAAPEIGAYRAPVVRDRDFKINIVKQPLIRKFINLWRNHGYRAPQQVLKRIMIVIRTKA
jgi:glycosyltransferase involved in cell wall biosynthesis